MQRWELLGGSACRWPGSHRLRSHLTRQQSSCRLGRGWGAWEGSRGLSGTLMENLISSSFSLQRLVLHLTVIEGSCSSKFSHLSAPTEQESRVLRDPDSGLPSHPAVSSWCWGTQPRLRLTGRTRSSPSSFWLESQP